MYVGLLLNWLTSSISFHVAVSTLIFWFFYMTSDSEKKKLHCNLCMGIRHHSVLHDVIIEHTEDDNEEYFYQEGCNYILAACDGCGDISLYMERWSSTQPDNEFTQWPPKRSRREPKWLIDLLLSENIDNPYKFGFLKEVYIALENNTIRLAVIGIRALLEQVMIESVGDQKSFTNNLKAFLDAGFISRVQKEAIEPVIEAGHASMHRGFKATKSEVEAILDVVENVIESIYISKQKVSKMQIPRRKNNYSSC